MVGMSSGLPLPRAPTCGSVVLSIPYLSVYDGLWIWLPLFFQESSSFEEAITFFRHLALRSSDLFKKVRRLKERLRLLTPCVEIV